MKKKWRKWRQMQKNAENKKKEKMQNEKMKEMKNIGKMKKVQKRREKKATYKKKMNHNNNNTIWRGFVFTSVEPPPHSGELNHALSQAGGPTQSQLSRPMSLGHHISMEHRLRRKQLNSDTYASNKTYLKEIQEKYKKKFVLEKMKKVFFFKKKRKGKYF